MTSKRSYRDVLSQDVVRGELEKGKASQFDPQIADIMIKLIEEDTHNIFTIPIIRIYTIGNL